MAVGARLHSQSQSHSLVAPTRCGCRGREGELFSGLELKYYGRHCPKEDEGGYKITAAKVLDGGKLLERLVEVTECSSPEGGLLLVP